MATSLKKPLRKKVVVITGATSGAGRAAALEFAKLQSTLVLAARNETALNDIADECEGFGAKVKTVPTDVTVANAVKALAEEAADFGGRIDVWINNAAVLAVGEFTRTPVEVHTKVIETNLLGYMYGAYAVLPYFKQQGEGILINNISIGGYMPVPYGIAYSASKYGVRAFAEALRGELYGYKNIHICNLFPAFLDTPGTQHAANYTGVMLKPAPPVYDPMRIAKTMVRLAQHPKPSAMITGLSPLIKFGYQLAPGLTRRIASTVLTTYFKHSEATPASSGNVFEPVQYGTSIYGGWNSPADVEVRKKRITTAALLLTGAAAGLMLLSKRKKSLG
jgi:short-subunit dehydrogenase